MDSYQNCEKACTAELKRSLILTYQPNINFKLYENCLSKCLIEYKNEKFIRKNRNYEKISEKNRKGGW
jgi:hypothetical protein